MRNRTLTGPGLLERSSAGLCWSQAYPIPGAPEGPSIPRPCEDVYIRLAAHIWMTRRNYPARRQMSKARHATLCPRVPKPATDSPRTRSINANTAFAESPHFAPSRFPFVRFCSGGFFLSAVLNCSYARSVPPTGFSSARLDIPCFLYLLCVQASCNPQPLPVIISTPSSARNLLPGV